MHQHLNLGQSVPNWQGCDKPDGTSLQGQYCLLKPFDLVADTHALFKAIQTDNQGETWTYLPYGPCHTLTAFADCMNKILLEPDTLVYTIFDMNGQALGVAGYLRMQPQIGVIEIGHVHFSKLMQKTPIATEAIYLLLNQVLDKLHYRRCEWKCHSLNEPSRKAALRFGFQFEGIFRQAGVYKGYNRDTAWYSIIDSEWPEIKARFDAWLNSKNFDASMKQIRAFKDVLYANKIEQGTTLLEKVFGKASSEAVKKKLSATPDFLRLLQENFADIYGDNTLDLKTKEIIVLTTLITQKDARPQLKAHLVAALRAGISQTEILALIRQLAMYIGFPSTINAIEIAQEVFSE